jgi:hypothetical protein
LGWFSIPWHSQFLWKIIQNSMVPVTTNQVSMKTCKSAGISRSHLASPWRWSRLLCPARSVPSPRARRVLHGATGSDLALPCAARRSNGGFWTIQGATSWRFQNMNGMGMNGLYAFKILYWLVVDLPLWKMMEFVSWDDEIPNTWKNNKCSKPPPSVK